MNHAIIMLLEQLVSEALDVYIKDLDHLNEMQVRGLIGRFETVLNLYPDNKYIHPDGVEMGYIYGYAYAALSLLSELYMRVGEYEKARRAILRAIVFTERFKDDGLFVYFQSDNFFELGMVEYFLGRTDEALSRFERSNELWGNYKAFLRIYLCLKKKRRIKEAKAYLKMAKTLKVLEFTRHKIS